MSEPRTEYAKRTRGSYSRLICLACRERRIRCELPGNAETPEPGEVRRLQTPCYRCKRLGIPCLIRRTILGRPTAATAPRKFQNSNATVDLPVRRAVQIDQPTEQDLTTLVHSSSTLQTDLIQSSDPPMSQGDYTSSSDETLLIYNPHSTETTFISRAIDTLRFQRAEEEWFRHLPAHIGRTPALDLSIKAMIAACAYSRGVPKLTREHCYQVLASALDAVQAQIKDSCREPNDDLLASAALLAPFEGVIKHHGIPTHSHTDGVAAILVARPATHLVSELARDVLDYYACESAIMACITDRPSPFESVSRAYFVNTRIGYTDSARAQLKALANELFLRIPRLVGLVRSLRLQQLPQKPQLTAALRLSKSLLELQDPQAEDRLLRSVKIHPSSDPVLTSPFDQSLYFASVQDFDALLSYWQTRLWLLRLEHQLNDLSDILAYRGHEPGLCAGPTCGPQNNEMFRLAKNILMGSEYAGTLPLRRHTHLFAYAAVLVCGLTIGHSKALGFGQAEGGIQRLSDLLLRRVNTALGAKPSFTLNDLNEAADVLVGGQVKGAFVKLYGWKM